MWLQRSKTTHGEILLISPNYSLQFPFFWASTEGKILSYNVGMGQKSDTTTLTEMIGWVGDIHVTLKFSGDFWLYTGLT